MTDAEKIAVDEFDRQIKIIEDATNDKALSETGRASIVAIADSAALTAQRIASRIRALAATPAVGGEDIRRKAQQHADHWRAMLNERPDWRPLREHIEMAASELQHLADAAAGPPASPLQGREYLAPSPCSDLSIGELIEWLDNPQWTNGYLNSDAANHMSAAAELIERLVSSAPPEQPASPLRGRELTTDADVDAWVASIGRITPAIRQRILDAVARFDKCRDDRPLVHTMQHDDTLTVGDLRSIAIALASPPEQPAADPSWRDDLGIMLSALRYFEEILGEKFHDEGGVIAEIERDHKCHAAAPVTDRFGEPVWPNNDEANDLDKGDDA